MFRKHPSCTAGVLRVGPRPGQFDRLLRYLGPTMLKPLSANRSPISAPAVRADEVDLLPGWDDHLHVTPRKRTCHPVNLFNRMVGCLHHRLGERVHYDETIAFPTRPEPVLTAAA
ncbi:hypothetical protein AB0L74_29150 [Streptomyces sp. NPDC052020]|uniref:hypothetical protein n=1 Tax=Streptomyces sp. NPDC052020 TaxID=3155677 RepID=UPI00341849F8